MAGEAGDAAGGDTPDVRDVTLRSAAAAPASGRRRDTLRTFAYSLCGKTGHPLVCFVRDGRSETTLYRPLRGFMRMA
jgi:hypothetical protein